MAKEILEKETDEDYDEFDPFGEERAMQILKAELIKDPFKSVKVLAKIIPMMDRKPIHPI